MRYEARLAAYDLFDLVQVTARVWDSQSSTIDDPPECLRVATTVLGEGEADPAIWLREALLALAEEL